jgi:hypothetical protein
MDMVLVTLYFDTMKDIDASSKSSAVGQVLSETSHQQIKDGPLQGRRFKIVGNLIFSTSQAGDHNNLPSYIFCEMNLTRKYLYFVSTKYMHG